MADHAPGDDGGVDWRRLATDRNVSHGAARVFAWNATKEKDTVMTPLDSIKYHRQMLQTALSTSEH